MNKKERDQITAGFLLHDPGTLGREFSNYMTEIKEDPGVKWFCPIDDITGPLRKGEVMMVVARPGMAKTTMTLAVARGMARAIEAGLVTNSDNKVVLYASIEQVVEDVETILQADSKWNATDLILGNVPNEVISRRASRRIRLPLWIIGRSRRFFGHKQPPLDADTILDSINVMIDDYGKKPYVIMLDYLQWLPSKEKNLRGNRREITEAVIREFSDLAKTVGVPIIITAQARREVDEYKMPLPEQRDIQHTSMGEQASDRMISLFRPILRRKSSEDKFFEVNGEMYDLDMNLLLIKHLKGRIEAAGDTHVAKFNPSTLEFTRPRKIIDMNKSEAYHQQSHNGVPKVQSALFDSIPPIDL